MNEKKGICKYDIWLHCVDELIAAPKCPSRKKKGQNFPAWEPFMVEVEGKTKYLEDARAYFKKQSRLSAWFQEKSPKLQPLPDDLRDVLTEETWMGAEDAQLADYWRETRRLVGRMMLSGKDLLFVLSTLPWLEAVSAAALVKLGEVVGNSARLEIDTILSRDEVTWDDVDEIAKHGTHSPLADDTVNLIQSCLQYRYRLYDPGRAIELTEFAAYIGILFVHIKHGFARNERIVIPLAVSAHEKRYARARDREQKRLKIYHAMKESKGATDGAIFREIVMREHPEMSPTSAEFKHKLGPLRTWKHHMVEQGKI